ncbi:uncharacterized protein CLUP02_09035 [Colletotrichum lupini]|uniref:Uncharacterized protein n=1 Tax=Colletotrichum lupini TaxID=145971 RepID=A0A9Q8WHK2_9PEZI|nr:uncharacterized protein CLUP02_09035 [Colletotrichum lupini]UQC83541.1 hypothetical protein CLUP02_09035 [Colletotrichum lupini]
MYTLDNATKLLSILNLTTVYGVRVLKEDIGKRLLNYLLRILILMVPGVTLARRRCWPPTTFSNEEVASGCAEFETSGSAVTQPMTELAWPSLPNGWSDTRVAAFITIETWKMMCAALPNSCTWSRELHWESRSQITSSTNDLWKPSAFWRDSRSLKLRVSRIKSNPTSPIGKFGCIDQPHRSWRESRGPVRPITDFFPGHHLAHDKLTVRHTFNDCLLSYLAFRLNSELVAVGGSNCSGRALCGRALQGVTVFFEYLPKMERTSQVMQPLSR